MVLSSFISVSSVSPTSGSFLMIEKKGMKKMTDKLTYNLLTI